MTKSFTGEMSRLTMFTTARLIFFLGWVSILSIFSMTDVAWADVKPASQIKVNKSVYDGHLNELRIVGSGFGRRCKQCEVIADYGRFRYSLPVKQWQPSEIVATVPNFGVDTVRLEIKTKQVSMKLRDKLAVSRKIVPKVRNSIVSKGAVPGLQMFEFVSDNRLGDKGVHSYDVNPEKLSCNASGLVFHDAKLQIGKRTRFAKAAILKKPSPGWKKPAAIKVKFYVEPTGFLHYQLHIYKEKIDGICKNRLRNDG